MKEELISFETAKLAKEAGFDVIVFVPSYDEDNGLITCGNAILSGSMPKCSFIEIKH